ncbi:MAG: phage holin family protein [bacterium]|nr:phage holin family protein [bacterium]
MKQNTIIFICRWFANSIALWVLISVFGHANSSADIGTYFLAGLIFSIVNSVLRPILTILSLPAIMITLGIFTLVVNGLILWISLAIAPNVSMSLWNAIVAGAVMSLVNYAINSYSYKNLEEEM